MMSVADSPRQRYAHWLEALVALILWESPAETHRVRAEASPADCAWFRRFNPASGNFWNGVASSDLSRSGWCPGFAVEPVFIPFPDLAPGRHRIQVSIPMGAPEGDSFSAWNISGVLIGEPMRPPGDQR